MGTLPAPTHPGFPPARPAEKRRQYREDTAAACSRDYAVSCRETKNPNPLPTANRFGFFRFGTPERIRTAGLPLRRRTLYPAELRTQMICLGNVLCYFSPEQLACQRKKRRLSGKSDRLSKRDRQRRSRAVILRGKGGSGPWKWKSDWKRAGRSPRW